MNNKRLLAISLLSIFLSNVVNSACVYPKKDFVIPSGTNSTKEEMLEIMGKFKALQVELEAYRTCLLDEEAAIPTDLENYDELVSFISKKHDGSIDEETAIADEWNAAVKAYNSK